MVREQPQIARHFAGGDGGWRCWSRAPTAKLAWHERSAQDIDHGSSGWQSAIGFDAKRGDTVEVVSMRFTSHRRKARRCPQRCWGWRWIRVISWAWRSRACWAWWCCWRMLFILRPMALRLTGMGETMMLAEGSCWVGPFGHARAHRAGWRAGIDPPGGGRCWPMRAWCKWPISRASCAPPRSASWPTWWRSIPRRRFPSCAAGWRRSAHRPWRGQTTFRNLTARRRPQS
jgi:hypothetical protein